MDHETSLVWTGLVAASQVIALAIIAGLFQLWKEHLAANREVRENEKKMEAAKLVACETKLSAVTVANAVESQTQELKVAIKNGH